MSLHEHVVNVMNKVIARYDGISDLSPTAIAHATQIDLCDDESLEIHIRYTSMQHLKQMARTVLSGRYGVESDETEAHQGDMFSGNLQSRYPIYRKRSDEPIYRKLEELTREDVNWNAASLRKSAKARMAHADALVAWDESRTVA